MNSTQVKHFAAIIVGSGFSGICMAIKLKQIGIDNFLVLEKANSLGGTWRENTYPGAECDVPSVMYSYSFAPNPDWDNKWSGQTQILKYQQDVVKQFDIASHIQFDTTVSAADYDSEQHVWIITTADETRYRCSHFITAIGQLHEVSQPHFENSEQFTGLSFHAAQWNHDVDLSNKNIAVIGNAASAVQLIPKIAKVAAHLTVYQRSPNWMLPKHNGPHGIFRKWCYKTFPFTQKLSRLLFWLFAEKIVFYAVKGNKFANWLLTKYALSNLFRRIKDPVLRRKLIPNYPLGAKRTLFSHEYYDALNLPHVELETTPIKHFTDTGLTTEDGQSTPLDVIIYATGFQTNPFLKSIQISGMNGTLLHEKWSEGAYAYLGIHTHEFPNFHMLYGPNTNLGHNSIIAMIEAQSNYIIQCLQQLNEQNASSIEIQHAIEQDYNRNLQAALNATNFNKIDQSWYQHNGKITNNWSGNVTEYKQKLKQPNWLAYQIH